MKKFMVLYSANESAMEQMRKSTPEEHKKGMEKWYAWKDKCGESMVDLGAPLGNGKKVSDSGNSASEKNIVGYSVLQAESMEDALKLLEGHPHLGWNEGCDIEIYECMPMPG